MVGAVAQITAIDALLWDYEGCPNGALGFDVVRALANARTLGALGEFLGWTVCAGSADSSVKLMMVLNNQERSGQVTCVFTVTLPAGVHSPQRLAEMCAPLLEAFGGDEAEAWNQKGTLLELSAKLPSKG